MHAPGLIMNDSSVTLQQKKKHVFVINIELKSLAPLVTDGYEHRFLLTVNTLYSRICM